MSGAVRISAARNDALSSYLKAIAILRLLSSRRGISVRGAWRDGALELYGISRLDLEIFFLDSYQPTPILNPWNSGAGFDGKSRLQTAGKTLDRVAAESSRWPEYATALAVAREVIDEFENTTGGDLKRDILLRLRCRYSDVALEWLDAAVLIGGTRLAFPTLLGTGGNDGHLDFSINFAKRALDVVSSKAIASRHVLLRDALDGTADAQLVKGIFGQYQLGAGDYINPWDYVLAIEGAIAFAGSVSRRFPEGSDRPSIPFQFDAVAAGYASASDDEDTRGELWLPAWRGQATYEAVRKMLRGGRVDLVTDQRGVARSESHLANAAADSLAALEAAQTYGVASGIESFGRVVVAKRNGLSFGATYVGRVMVADRPEIAALSRDTRTWVHRAAKLGLGAAGQAALRTYNEGMIDYATDPKVSTLQQTIAALADLDNAVALSRGEHRPIPFLPAEIFDTLDAGLETASPRAQLEHRVARALTSIGARRREHRLRYKIGRVTFEVRGDVYDAQRRFTWKPDVRDTLSEVFVRAIREATSTPTSDEGGFAARLRGSSGVTLDDLARLLAGGVDWARIKTVLRAYSIIEPTIPKLRAEPTSDPTTQPLVLTDAMSRKAERRLVVPVAFAALKTLVYGFRPNETVADTAYAKTTYLDDETAHQLEAGKTQRALHGAFNRLRAAGADVRDFRLASIERSAESTFIAGLFVPIKPKTARDLLRQILLERSSTSIEYTRPHEEIA